MWFVPKGYKGTKEVAWGVEKSSREDWVEFWKWQSKVTEKKWQERD
jgi:hypothetical protein